MTGANWQEAKQIFLRLRDVSPERRGALLEEACGDDAALRAEVASLLDCHGHASSFLEAPAVQLRTGASELVAPQDSVVGRRIGGYEVVRELAAGGMGVVYEARQEHPNRIVALKVARVGLGSTSARRRFAHEAEILARLQHPNIAQVYEAGTHDEGGSATPYFAMELVQDAQPITNYATTHSLSSLDRLRLFAEVCDAVHYGHQKGIVHRDLKPGNILIDGEGRPKVIDFGVARVVDPDARIATTQTSSGQMLGTLQYMSPEQFDGDPLAVDVRSDVYGLGIVLFELLCGELPYDVTKSGLYEAARTIQQHPPRQPSSCLRELRGDIETIILRCLDKVPERRYASVAELAADIRRHLRHEPIEARRDSTLYVLRKNLYRHRLATGGLALLTCAVVALSWAIMSRHHALQSDRAAREAETRAALGLARTWTRDKAPVAASTVLWSEFFKRDSNRTRFALWELYLNYPRIEASSEYGAQTDVSHSPSGKWIATVTRQGDVILRDPNTGRSRLAALPETSDARVIEFSRNEPARLFVGCASGQAHVYDFDDEAGELHDPNVSFPDVQPDGTAQGPVSCLALSPDGQYLAIGRLRHLVGASDNDVKYRDSTVSLWNLEKHALEWDTLVENRRACGLVFSPANETGSNSLLAIAFTRRWMGPVTPPVEVWSCADGSAMWKGPASRSGRRGVAFAPDGQSLFSIGDQLVWAPLDPNSGTLRETVIVSPARWGLRSIDVGRGAAAGYVVCSAGDGQIYVYDSMRHELLSPMGYHDCDQSRIAVSWSPCGEYLASAGPDGFCRWRFRPGRYVGSTAESTRVVAVSEAGAVVVLRDMRQDELHDNWCTVRLLIDGEERRPEHAAGAHVALTPDGQRLALASPVPGSDDSHLYQVLVRRCTDWALVTDEPLRVRSGIKTMHWLVPACRHLMIGLEDGRVLAWDTQGAAGGESRDAEVVHRFTTECTRFAFDVRGDWLAVSCQGDRDERIDAEACLFRRVGVPAAARFESEFELHHVMRGVAADLWCVALVQDDHDRLILATSGNRHDVELWDALSDTHVGRLVGHSDSVVTYATEDGHLVTASRDGTVRLWDVPTQQELCVIRRVRPHYPTLAICGNTIATCDGRRLQIVNPREADQYVERNREYEQERLKKRDDSGRRRQ